MDYLRLLRLHQWIKNIFVLLPLFIAGNLNNISHWQGLLMCFASFCLASSSVYILNDIFDAENDRKHAIKKNRPIANGSVSEIEGWAMSACLALLSGVLAHFASGSTLSFVIAYLILNIFYSTWTKHIPMLDCASIALGFCLRFLAGGVGFGIPVNPQLLTSCYFGALAMALIKRRIELSGSTSSSAPTRPSLKGLSLPVVDLLVGIFSSCAIILYAQWTLVVARPIALFTLPFLSILFSRIVWLAYLNKNGEDFSKTLLFDIFALACTAIFIASLAFSIYG
jgi:decaprenyl-phosphate phosphoribosyltransferase